MGVEHVRRILINALQCLSYEELNRFVGIDRRRLCTPCLLHSPRHILCNLFDLLIEQVIPNVATAEFLTKYVQMHAGARS